MPGSNSPDALLDRLVGLPAWPKDEPDFDEPGPPPDDFDDFFLDADADADADAAAAAAPPPAPPQDPASPPPPPSPPPADVDEDPAELWGPGSGPVWSVGEGDGGWPGRDLEPPFPSTPPLPPDDPSEWERRWEGPIEWESGDDDPKASFGAYPSRGGPRLVEPVVRILGPEPFARPGVVGDDGEPTFPVVGDPPRPESSGSTVLLKKQARPQVADGHTTNGHTANGHTANGHTANGHTANGHASNGTGHATNSNGSAEGGKVIRLSFGDDDLPPPPPDYSSRPAIPPGGRVPRAVGGSAAPELRPVRARPNPTPPLTVVSKQARPRGRFGVLWAFVTVVLLALGHVPVAIWLAVCAAAAAVQAAAVRRGKSERPLVLLAGVTAAALPLSAIAGPKGMAGAVVGAALLTMLVQVTSRTRASVRDAALTVGIGAVIGLAVASLVLLRDFNAAAALLLLSYTAAYDASAYLIGTGASKAWEGPVAGVFMLIPITMLSAVTLVPDPFPEASPLLLGAIAAVLVPCGPIVASALLGEPVDAKAPALRRLDSLLVLAPLWSLIAAAFLR